MQSSTDVNIQFTADITLAKKIVQFMVMFHSRMLRLFLNTNEQMYIFATINVDDTGKV